MWTRISAKWRRRWAPAAIVLVAGIVVFVSLPRLRDAAPRLDRRVAQPLDMAAASVSAMIDSARTRDSARVRPEVAIAAGYLERHRLGFADPFRLADLALADPQLTPESRRGVAWLLVRQAYFGQGYELPAAVFATLAGRDSLPRAAQRLHASFVQRAIEELHDPREAETALRIAYQLAVAERTIQPRVAQLAIRLAALARDRALARRDAHALIDASRAARVDPLALVPSWRASLRFSVERPLWEQRPWRRESALAAARWLLALRAVAADSTVDSSSVRLGTGRLSRGIALRLLEAASEARLPPQPAVVLALRERRQGGMLRDAPRASNEESLAAALSLLPPADPAGAAIALDAAIGLRVFAQERAWFPGDPAPTARDLRRRFGYAAIEFDPALPAQWRGYLLQSLASATADLQRVLPGMSVAGATIRFRARTTSDTLLALHVAQSRTLVLPVGTGAGTLAHELAHDVDARAARVRYGRGGYATDLAVEGQDGRLAASVAGLAPAPLVPPGDGRKSSHRQRPAEAFARTLEWLVPAALARDGRMNGYLSSVQDEVLTGSGSVLPADVSLGSLPALADILDEMPVAGARLAARAMRERFAGASEWTPLRLTRLVLDAPLRGDASTLSRGRSSFRDPVAMLADALPAQPPACGGAGDDEAAWRGALVRAAVEARLRGIARYRMRRPGLDGAPLARLLGVAGPWSDAREEYAIARARERLLAGVYARAAQSRAFAAAVGRESGPWLCERR